MFSLSEGLTPPSRSLCSNLELKTQPSQPFKLPRFLLKFLLHFHPQIFFLQSKKFLQILFMPDLLLLKICVIFIICVLFQNPFQQQRYHYFVMSYKIISFPPIFYRSFCYIYLCSIVHIKIKNGSCKILNLAIDISSNR